MSKSTKEKSAEYKSGYGQAKAHILQFINEALESVHDARDQAYVWLDDEEKIKEAKVKLQIRIEELQRIRSCIRSL